MKHILLILAMMGCNDSPNPSDTGYVPADHCELIPVYGSIAPDCYSDYDTWEESGECICESQGMEYLTFADQHSALCFFETEGESCPWE